MIPLSTGVRVWIAAGHTDMRRGMQSLALLVQEAFKRDPHLCVGRDYVAAHPRSPQLSGNAGLCRHILSGHLFSRLGMFSARLQWGEDHVGTVFQV
jgi:transposase